MFHNMIVLLESLFSVTGKDSQSDCSSRPIMLALCLMLLGTYHARKYADIIGLGLLHIRPKKFT